MVYSDRLGSGRNWSRETVLLQLWIRVADRWDVAVSLKRGTSLGLANAEAFID